ncbi:hypothetical protein TIFTF001_034553 [Ficus carica]|uniref:Leucine-rich repeat-containing N-terminal plant-type domain-containing protein n=1 Tax=Ficus carica TaxID=3494 RepID=A0AA88E0L6_FICCA|nr:hypothetical protein TIFTF001_034532 [Ficus carica]GMN65480.1 hypothetical protein TIFTF001_034553 [Ficus carica]
MSRSSLHILIVLVAFLIYFSPGALGATSGGGEPRIRCKEEERQALLRIREDFYELEDGVLSSWGKEEERRECCEWIGIRCDNPSGHVIGLDLSPSTFGGHNDSPIRVACLRSSDVVLPPLLLNSSKVLAILDLSDNVRVSDSIFRWLLNYNYSLVYLDLHRCNLKGSIPKAFRNMSALTHLDLAYNNLEGSIPDYFGNMIALEHLDLGDNQQEGSIPESFVNMIALAHLGLHFNHLESSVPEYFGNLSTLAHLDIGKNNLEGSIRFVFLNYRV